MLFIPSALLDTATNAYTVTAIDRQEVFAGVLGNRVEETLTLSKDGKTVQVKLAPQHTRFGSVKQFHIGQVVAWNGHTFLGLAHRNEVK